MYGICLYTEKNVSIITRANISKAINGLGFIFEKSIIEQNNSPIINSNPLYNGFEYASILYHWNTNGKYINNAIIIINNIIRVLLEKFFTSS